MSEGPRFRTFRAFNDPALAWAARSRFRLDRRSVETFRGEPLPMRIVAALGERRAMNVKEVLESFETVARVRKRLRSRRVADLCCGHGLTGLLFAAIDRDVEQVVLLDRKKPPKADLVLEAVTEAAPWVSGKVRWIEDKVARAGAHLEAGTSVIAVHACGVRTDRAIEAAIAVNGHVAVVPCCYTRTAHDAPAALREALGAELTADIHRTYALEAKGYRASWTAIPEAITPMNRVLIGQAPR